jgi:hypothetical protein
MTRAEMIAEFARLDQVASFIVPRLRQDIAFRFRDAMMTYGSIDAMPEPFRSWCENPKTVQEEYLEAD